MKFGRRAVGAMVISPALQRGERVRESMNLQLHRKRAVGAMVVSPALQRGEKGTMNDPPVP